ncbi:hypothetical protein [Pseudomonas entomophila]|uniref:Uncharacterized protein n=1 Tax=Pseudomonas entomophila TaxID=312306 RepID=A0ABY9QQF8_9PSED|nr:hypothetical protein [Pseudomonas entomophila]WMW05330.1 hypothetical protein RAH46_23880 [Pseudomonas entomophila]
MTFSFCGAHVGDPGIVVDLAVKYRSNDQHDGQPDAFTAEKIKLLNRLI